MSKIKKLICLTQRQIEYITSKAEKLQISSSEVVRRALDKEIELEEKK